MIKNRYISPFNVQHVDMSPSRIALPTLSEEQVTNTQTLILECIKSGDHDMADTLTKLLHSVTTLEAVLTNANATLCTYRRQILRWFKLRQGGYKS